MGWKIGFETNFTVSIGKSGKYVYKFLEKNEWDKFLKGVNVMPKDANEIYY